MPVHLLNAKHDAPVIEPDRTIARTPACAVQGFSYEAGKIFKVTAIADNMTVATAAR